MIASSISHIVNFYYNEALGLLTGVFIFQFQDMQWSFRALLLDPIPPLFHQLHSLQGRTALVCQNGIMQTEYDILQAQQFLFDLHLFFKDIQAGTSHLSLFQGID